MSDNIKIFPEHDKCHCFASIHFVYCTIIKTENHDNTIRKINY